MKTVFILEHAYELDGNEEIKFIGAYSTQEEANNAIDRLKGKPGFKNRPDAFTISEHALNTDGWTEGYVTLVAIQVKNRSNEWITVQAERLANNRYQILELYANESLGEFKHLDIVECEKRDGELYAIKLSGKTNDGPPGDK